MLRKRLGFVLVSVIALSLGSAAAVCEALDQTGGTAGSSALEASWGRLPLRFEANEGQLDSRVLFVSRGSGFNLSLTREGASLLFVEPARRGMAEAAVPPRSLAVDLRLVGGNAAPQVAGESPAAPANYFVGRDPSRWRRGVQAYESVRYDAVYPGVDLVFHGRQGRLEYDFVVAPGADPGQIELDISGADGLTVDTQGSLVISAGDRSLIQPRPVLYQEGPRGRQEVAGGYVLHEDRVKFTVAAYDRSLPLVIDPVFTYASYYGGGGIEELFGIAHDAQGNVWATGLTSSANLPVSAGALDGAYGGAGDVFVTKFDKNWNTLFSSYIGGTGFEQSWAMALDKAGNAYLVGNTRSTDFPVVGGIQTSLSGDRDAFLVKLNPTGTQILYSTYLGGRETDWGYFIELDSKGAIYIAGETESPDFPVRSAAQSAYHGGEDAFVTKLTPDGAIVYSTFIGGGNTERAWGVRVDGKGIAYVAGQTGSPNFPTANAFQRRFGGGRLDAFMTAIAEDGKSFVYSTFAGGTSTDQGFAVAVDAKGNARYTGGAGNKTFPLRQAIQPTYGGGPSDVFVLGLSKNGALQFSTFIGGSLGDAAFAMGLDAQSNIYVTGQTESTNYPVRNALQTKLGGLRDGFLTKLRPDGKAYIYSTFFGGSTIDEGTAIDVASSGLLYIGGFSDGNFPLVSPEQGTYAGLRDGVITRMSDGAAQGLAVSCATAARRLPRANGGLIDVGLSAQVAGGDGAAQELAVQVFGDDGATLDDMDSPEPGRLLLRAERSSAASDRVYLIVVSAKDGAGNRGSATCSVVVPRSQKPDDVESALARAAALENSFERQRVLPAGFSRLDGTGAGIQ